MQTVLCFGDSNTYGLNPRDKSRFDYDTRWTGILDKKLQPYGFRTAEEGLCGRTTVFPDEVRSSRRGVMYSHFCWKVILPLPMWC